MNSRYLFILFLSVALLSSCKKEGVETIKIEGVITDAVSNQPLPGILIFIDAIKPPSGMGMITDGNSENVGSATTDANGYYKVRLKVFKEAERLEFNLEPIKQKDDYAGGQKDIYIRDFNKSSSNKVNLTLTPRPF